MNDGVTSEVSLAGAAVREKSGKQAPSENRGLIVFLGVLGVMIVGLSTGIVLVNLRKGGGENGGVSDVVDNTKTGVPVEDIVIPDSMPGSDGDITPVTRASLFADSIEDRLDSDLDYSVEDASHDYQKAIEESEGDLKFSLSLGYADFIINKTNDVELAIMVLKDVETIAMSNRYNAGLYYDRLYRFYTMLGKESEAEQYHDKYDELITNGVRLNYEED